MSGASVRSSVVHAAAAALVGMLAIAVGQPMFTDDAWWHLALGRSYWAEGPWLGADPLLFTASGPPAPASWVFDVALHGIERVAGFAGLRVAHVGAVGAILALVWSSLRRAGGSAALASGGTACFAALSAYRLVQLRPHLLTILATLLLFRWVIEGGRKPSLRRAALAVALLALWANVHAGFLIGPVALAAAAAGLLASAVLPGRGSGDGARAAVLGAVLGIGVVATFANPAGIDPHLAWLRAGSASPSLERVSDEWASPALLAWPAEDGYPSPLCWLLTWALIAATVALTAVAARARRREERGFDPALVGLAAMGAVAMASALRFAWLGVFPLLLVATWARGVRPRPIAAWLATASALALPLAFAGFGDWPRVSRGIRAQSYDRPYPPGKWYADAVWFMADANLAGRLFGDYFTGGFAGYWLAPRIRTFVNGTLNFPPEVFEAHGALRERRGLGTESFTDLLDRHGVDLFFGIRLPRELRAGRFYTTGHLEREPGWLPVFRNLDSAVYLRANERNAENLERVAAYYEAAGVPFSRDEGFDVLRAVAEAPRWSLNHGILPVDFVQLQGAVRGGSPRLRRLALHRIASIYAALGLYEQSISLDDRLLAAGDDAAARFRSDWSRARLANPAARPPPLFTRAQADALRFGFVSPLARTER